MTGKVAALNKFVFRATDKVGCGCYNGGYGKWSGGGGGWPVARFLCSCFIFILMSSLYYLNVMLKNIEVLMFDVS